jgi:electron transfer flavoprotein beta subunit
VVREVWDTRDLTGEILDGEGSIRDGALQTRFEPEDLNALEMALRWKDEQGGRVTAVSIGQPREVDVLRECLYRGADAVLRVDADPAALDAEARAALLAEAITSLDGVQLVLVGTTVADAENSLAGAHLATRLGLHAVSWVDAIEEIDDRRAVAKRAVEMGYEYVEAPFPALLAVGVALLEDDPRTPRSAKAMLKLKMKKAPIDARSAADLGVADPAGLVTTRLAGMEGMEQRLVESRVVDTEDEAALQGMLDDVLKGE